MACRPGTKQPFGRRVNLALARTRRVRTHFDHGDFHRILFENEFGTNVWRTRDRMFARGRSGSVADLSARAAHRRTSTDIISSRWSRRVPCTPLLRHKNALKTAADERHRYAKTAADALSQCGRRPSRTSARPAIGTEEQQNDLLDSTSYGHSQQTRSPRLCDRRPL